MVKNEVIILKGVRESQINNKLLPTTMEYGYGLCSPPLSVLFKMCDSQGGGSVGREDMEKVMEAMHKMVAPLLAQETAGEEGGGKGGVGGGHPDELSVAASTRVKEICKILTQVSMLSPHHTAVS